MEEKEFWWNGFVSPDYIGTLLLISSDEVTGDFFKKKFWVNLHHFAIQKSPKQHGQGNFF